MSESNQKGEIAELKFMLACIEKGYHIGRTQQDCPYDALMDRDGKLSRVQIKYRTKTKDGTIVLKIKNGTFTNRRTYDSSNVDYFGVYVPDTDKVYLIPISECEGKVDAVFRITPPKNNSSKCNMLVKYKDW